MAIGRCPQQAWWPLLIVTLYETALIQNPVNDTEILMTFKSMLLNSLEVPVYFLRLQRRLLSMPVDDRGQELFGVSC